MATITLKDDESGEEFILTMRRVVDEEDGWDSFLALTEEILYMWLTDVGSGSAMAAEKAVREMHQRFLETGEPQRYGGEA